MNKFVKNLCLYKINNKLLEIFYLFTLFSLMQFRPKLTKKRKKVKFNLYTPKGCVYYSSG